MDKLIGGEKGLRDYLFESVGVGFDDEIVTTGAGEDVDVPELDEFKKGEEEEDGVEPAFTGVEDGLEWEGFLVAEKGEYLVSAALHGVIISEDGMDGFVVALALAADGFFEGFG